MGGRRGATGFLPQISIVTPTRRYALGGAAGEAGDVVGASGVGRAPSLAAEAMRWNAVLRGRERWRDSAEIQQRHAQDAAAVLQGFGLGPADLRELAAAERVVVEMPYRCEAEGWEGRILPWEFLLARATRAHRRADRRMTVMRRLMVPAPVPRVAELAPRVLVVQARSGALAAAGDGLHTLHRLREALRLDHDDGRWQLLPAPTLAQLRHACQALLPEIVHLDACDSHQGLALLLESEGPGALVQREDGRITELGELLRSPATVLDGVLLRNDDGLPCLVSPLALAQALAPGPRPPFFVGLNLWNSAARLAPLLLPAGVLASVGFQDSFDEALATYFYENLYDQLMWLNGDLPAAFEGAWAELRRQADLSPGTAIALWARAPLLPAEPGRRPTRRAGAVPVPAATARPGAPLAPPVRIELLPRAEIHYAELHNRQPLFERFEVLHTDPEADTRLRVELSLQAGLEPARFDAEFALQGLRRLNLAERVVLPLTAELLRTVSEAIHSTLTVRLSVEGRTVLAQTLPLRLLPVDQWHDNAHSGRWLPSFVLPRDAAVQAAVSAAQRYVRVIRDDPGAGFEGYQAAPGTDEAALDNIDLQVEAIWATLLHEWQLGYVNPPPAYSAQRDAQRLRTPGAVQRARMGTCLDLSLLLSACLELVDIHPVVFLLKGHALPGYWRHHQFREQFRSGLGLPVAAAADTAGQAAVATHERSAWVTAHHPSVWALVRAGQLAPLEAVRLTDHGGFRAARQAGIHALREAADFDALIDITTAREHLVTPLPILGERA